MRVKIVKHLHVWTTPTHSAERVDRMGFFLPLFQYQNRGSSNEPNWWDRRRRYIVQRLICLWDSLSQDMVMGMSLDRFKRGLDKITESINCYVVCIWIAVGGEQQQVSLSLSPACGLLKAAWREKDAELDGTSLVQQSISYVCMSKTHPLDPPKSNFL